MYKFKHHNPQIIYNVHVPKLSVQMAFLLNQANLEQP